MLTNFFKAGFGSVAAQVINIAALPVIARVYSPEAYAIWAIVIATSAIFGGISCLRYELAIVLPEEKDDASALLLWSIASSVTFGVVVALVTVVLFAGGYLGAVESGQRLYYVAYAPLLVSATGLTLALQYWAVRHGAFALTSVAQILLAVATLGVQFEYAMRYGASADGLLLGSLAGQVSALVVLAAGCLFARNLPTFSAEVVRRVVPAIREHYRFPLYSLPYVLFGTIRERASVYVLALFLGTRDVGLYALAYRIMNFPVSLVSAALRPVMFRAASVDGAAALEGRINVILFWLGVVATPFVVVYFYWSKELFAMVFGEQWRGASLYGEFFILPVLTFMFCNWMDRIMDVIGQQRLTMVLEIVFGSLSVAVLAAAFAIGLGLRSALLAQCMVLIAYNLTYLVLAYDRAGYAKKPLLGHLCTVVIVALVTVAVIEVFVAWTAN